MRQLARFTANYPRGSDVSPFSVSSEETARPDMGKMGVRFCFEPGLEERPDDPIQESRTRALSTTKNTSKKLNYRLQEI